MEMELFNFIKASWDVISIIFVITVATITAFFKWKGIKSYRTLREEYLKSFEQLITNLSSDNPSSQLTAAILLRRFFCIDEMKEHKHFLKEETINVISSLLRTLPTGIYQKTIGDGLAYAGDLSNADLQKTNLQDICLEGKKERLILNNCDLYMADLSEALIKNVDAEGAFFYNSILLKTRIKNSNLKKANFRNADLTKIKFENVELYDADFTGATNIPKEIAKGLKKVIDKDGNTKMLYQESTTPITTTNSKIKGNIFFSIPGCRKIKDSALISEYKKIIENLGYNVICYTRDQYPQFGQINKIRLDIIQSSGMIVFGLKQLKIEKGTLKPGTSEENEWNMKWMHTPWNDLEVGLGVMIGLPILLVKDNDINSGIFDSHLSESFIATISSELNIENIKDNDAFRLWCSKTIDAQFNILAENTDLIKFMAQKEHEIWCENRLIEGWKYGPCRNDITKENPTLIPFEDLPNTEKEISYSSAKKTLSLIDDFLFTLHKQTNE